MLKKVLFFSLYLLGARVAAIASLVEMPEESGKTAIKRVIQDGLSAFTDRRLSENTDALPACSARHPGPSVLIDGDCCIITFGDTECPVKIPMNHKVHLKSVLLSLLQADLLSIHTVSSILNVTPAYCRMLADKLSKDDVPETLVDKRKGQNGDIYVDQSLRAELILHFAARAVTGHSTSSNELARVINETGKTNISPRTIRWHMNKLGLVKIRKTLPGLVATLKKKS